MVPNQKPLVVFKEDHSCALKAALSAIWLLWGFFQPVMVSRRCGYGLLLLNVAVKARGLFLVNQSRAAVVHEE